MIINKIMVSNFRCLKYVECPLSTFSTLIGENNSGKSSLMESIIVFINGTKLKSSDYYDNSKDIVFEVHFIGVTDEILNSLMPEHKARIQNLVVDQEIKLIRRYDTDGSSNLRCIRAVPKEDRFKSEIINNSFKGLKGNEITERLEEIYPELAGNLDKQTQTRAKEIIEFYIAELPKDVFEDQECDLPTGIDNSIRALFPEPVYIPAVKDLSDDIKTRESTTFGKLLSILLNVIEAQLIEAEETFENINKKLNRLKQSDGSYKDDRLHEVQEIEKQIEIFVREHFPSTDIHLEIPPPEIKTVISSAKIMVNDGVESEVDTKGDGLKRSVTFAILRAYVTLAARPEWNSFGGISRKVKDRYLFLFEEPELYLHPHSQKILFNALKQISHDHQILISTHSPIFLSPSNEGSFIKMIRKQMNDHFPPSSFTYPLDLDDLSIRDQYQLICYDNNNAALFSDSIVLVEGDSDHIFISHTAKVLNPKWDFNSSKISISKVNGKGSIERYRKFFNKFNVTTFVIADLDVLIHDFDKLGLSEEINQMRAELLVQVDNIIKEHGFDNTPSSKLIKKEISRLSWQEKWKKAKEVIHRIKKGEQITQEDINTFDELFTIELIEPRLHVLKNSFDIQSSKIELIRSMYQEGVFVLCKGSIEDYYPLEVSGADKPSKAQDFCKRVISKAELQNLCEIFENAENGERISEFEEIFTHIFNYQN